MSDPRHARLTELFATAKDLDEPARAAFVTEHCGDDAALRAQLEAMLAFDRDSPQFLGGSALDDVRVQDALGHGDADVLPRAIGRYRVVRKIGEGGMGVVFAAEQDTPKRIVALKILRTAFASDDALRRFALEAEVLGRLQHPGIAHVFEAGVTETSDGARMPFLAMEFVDGTNVVKHASDRRLAQDARIQLFLALLDAVDHAHRKGVIHRDLKPANVLVDSAGRPKVLDFGVARIVGDDAGSLHTQFGSIIGTLETMSPEQAAGDAADTRSDLYSLGTILFELLAGVPPRSLRGKDITEALRLVREAEAPRLSSVCPQASADLDVIVAHALERDPERRYASVSAFGEDLRRFLAHEPILAKPASALDRARKFARRHRVPLSISALLFVSLAIGLVTTWTQWRTADRRRIEAETARNDAKDARDAELAATDYLLKDVLRSPDPSRDGRFVRVVDVLERAAAGAASQFADRPKLEGTICDSLALSFRALGLLDRADALSARAVEKCEIGFGAEHERTIEVRLNRIELLLYLERIDDAEPLLNSTLALCRRTLAADAPQTSTANSLRASLLFSRGRVDEAILFQRDVLAGRLTRLDADAEPIQVARNNLSVMLVRTGKFEEAEQLARLVLDAHTRRKGPDHPDTLGAAGNLAQVLEERRLLDDAEQVWRDLVARAEQTFGVDHPATLGSLLGLATALAARGNPDDARAMFERVLRVRDQVLGKTNVDTLRALRELAKFEIEHGTPDVARKRSQELVDAWRAAGRGDDPQFANALNTFGRACRATDDLDGAIASFREATSIYDRTYATPTPALAETLYNLGVTLRERDDFVGAIETLERSLAADLVIWGEGHTYAINCRGALARAFFLAGRFADAEAAARDVLERELARKTPNAQLVRRTRLTLGQALLRQDRADEALTVLADAYSASAGDFGNVAKDVRIAYAEALEAVGRSDEAAKIRAEAPPPKQTP